MPSSKQNTPNISLSRNDILKISKEEFDTIEEYNEFIYEKKEEIKSRISEIIKIKQVYSQKVAFMKSMLNEAIEFKSVRLTLSQIENSIKQINETLYNYKYAYKILILSEEEIPSKKHNRININENKNNENNKKLINENANNLTNPDLSDKKSCEEIKESNEKSHHNEELDNSVKGSTSKIEKENSNQTKGNNKYKSKPKLKIKKLNKSIINYVIFLIHMREEKNLIHVNYLLFLFYIVFE